MTMFEWLSLICYLYFDLACRYLDTAPLITHRCAHSNTCAGKIHAVDGGVASEYSINCADCGDEIGYYAYGSEQYD